MASIINSPFKRALFISASLILGWSYLVFRLYHIQIIRNQYYTEQCRRQSDCKRIIEPVRGTILDRTGKALTANVTEYSIAAYNYLIEDKSEYAQYLSHQFGQPVSKYSQILQPKRTFTWVERNVPFDKALPLMNNQNKRPGLDVIKRSRRQYPFGEIIGQLIGLADVDNSGISGLELEFNGHLNGEAGWQLIQRDGWGRLNVRLDLPSKQAIDGNHLYLTIDLESQTILYEELESAYRRHHADKAMGVVLDPKTGQILAMAAIPAFNPNLPGQFSQTAQKNTVVTDIFEPGSTFKIVTATAALDGHFIKPSDTLNINQNYIVVGKRTIREHSNRVKVHNFGEVIQKSSNVGTIKVAQRIGRDQVFNYMRRYGFGVKTGLQFPGEVAGIVHPLKDWTDLSLAQIAIGHGIGCSALQLAMAYAAIANGGLLLAPQIVKSITTPDNIVLYEGSTRYIRRVASEETMATMRELLRLTVTQGTGINANINGMAIAGKTGTAQKVTDKGYSQTEYIATFAGFFPADDPKLLCVVVIDNPKGQIHTGGLLCAPIVAEIFKRLVNLSDELFFHEELKQTAPLQIAAKPSVRKAASVQVQKTYSEPMLNSVGQTYSMPDLIGKSSREALVILQQMGLKPKISGSGLVISQTPAHGAPVVPGQSCLLKLESRRVSID